MTEEERIKVEKECRTYLEELDKDPMTGPNCWDADSLTLGVMFRRHPSLVSQISPEVIDRVKSNKLYEVFKDETLKISREKGWMGVVSLERVGTKKILSEADVKEIQDSNRMRQTGGLSLNDYQKAADELVNLWKMYLDRENKKVKK